MPEVASLVVAVDATAVDKAAASLNALAQAAAGAQASVGGVGSPRTTQAVQATGQAAQQAAQGVAAAATQTSQAVGAMAASVNAGAGQVTTATQRITQGLNRTQQAAQQATQQFGLNRLELINFSRQMQDVATMAMMGMSPFMILSSQGFQIMDILTSTRGSMADFGRQILSVFTVGRVVAGGFAAALLAGAAAAITYTESLVGMERAVSGIGRTAGVTAAQLTQMARRAAEASGGTVSVSGAATNAAALAQAGVRGEFIEQLAGRRAYDLAAQTGMQQAEAVQFLGRAFADPARGAEMLQERIRGLTAEQIRSIQTLQQQGDTLGAGNLLLQALDRNVRDNTETLGFWARAWNSVEVAASNAWRAVGRGVVGGGQDTSTFERAQRDVANLERDLARANDMMRRLQEAGMTQQNNPQVFQQMTQQVENLNRQLERARALMQSLSPAAVQAAAEEGNRVRLTNRVQEELPQAERIIDPRRAAVERAADDYRRNYNMERDIAEARQRARVTQDPNWSPADEEQAERLREAQERRRAFIQNNLRRYEQGWFSPEGELRADNRTLTREVLRPTDVEDQRARLRDLESQARNATTNRQMYEEAVIRQRRRVEDIESGMGAGSQMERDQRTENQLAESRLETERQLRAQQAERLRQQEAQTEGVRRETAAMGGTAGQMQAARIEGQMIAEATRERQRALGETARLSQQELDAIRGVARAAGEALDAQERRRLSLENQRDLRMIGLSDQDQKIAQRLQNLYPDPRVAIQSGEAAAMRFVDSLRAIRDAGSDAFGTLARDLLQGRNAMESLSNMASRLAGQLVEYAARQLWQNAFGMAVGGGGFGGGFGNMLAGVLGGGFKGGVGLGGIIGAVKMHSGGTAGVHGEPILIPSHLLNSAPRYHSGYGGLGADEVAAVLRQGEVVVTPEEVARAQSAAAGGPQAMGEPIREPKLEVNITVPMPQGGNPEDGRRYGQAAGEAFREAVKGVIADEMRMGGMFSPTAYGTR